MKIIKWCLILVMVFLSAILAFPFFVMAFSLDTKKSEEFLDYIGEKLKDRLIKDFLK